MGKFVNVGSILTTVVAAVLKDEFVAWFPWFAKRLLQIAVSTLPAEQRCRYQEEWSGHLFEMPGELGKLATAVSFTFAAFKIRCRVVIQEFRALPIWNRIRTKLYLHLLMLTVLFKCWQYRMYAWAGIVPKPTPVSENSSGAWVFIVLLLIFFSKASTPAKIIELQ